MKVRIYITLFLLVALNSIYAQVGIGTTSPDGALDVTSTTDGMLIPRVALAATNVATITTPTISELVYNTFTSAAGPNQVTPGFYYWDGALWNKLAVGNTNNDWTLTGNTGTNIATNFFGTTDNKDIIFKRNNIRAGYIGDPYYDPTTFDYNNGNTVFGANSLLNPTINIGTQTGVRNTAFGVNVMPALTTGRLNIGVGDFALFSNQTGNGNLAVGNGALYTNIAGANNVAIGRNALTSSDADNNTAVGYATLRQNTSGTGNTALGREALRGTALTSSTGNNNTAIGYQSGLINLTGANNVSLGAQSFSTNTTGSGNVGIGYQSGALETGSNKLYVANSNANANNALIYGEFDNKIVRVNGTLQISNPASAPGYSLPIVRGNSGQVLQTDGAGATSWANSLNSLSIMRVRLSADQVVNSTGWQKVTFNTTTFDTNSEFSANRFTATKAGYYEINAGIHTFNKSDSEQYSIAVYKNNAEYQETSAHHYGDKLISRTINCVVSLAVGDYIEIFFYNGNAPTTIDSFSGKTYFEVKQVK